MGKLSKLKTGLCCGYLFQVIAVKLQDKFYVNFR